MGQNGKRFFKLRRIVSVDSSAGGVLQVNATNDPSTFEDWTNVAALFDTYRVCAIKIKFIPSLPNDTSLSTGFFPLYVVGDSNSSSSPLTSDNVAIQYENMKVMNMYRPWKYYYYVPKQTAGASGVIYQQGGYRDMLDTTATAAVYSYGTGFDASTNYGKAILTHYITAKNRK